MAECTLSEPSCDVASKDRVAIVGAGSVGATTAYALLLSGLASDITLINRNRKKAEGEAEDISHAEPWSHTTMVRAGGFEDCATAKVIVVAVGAGLAPGETRIDLLKKNAVIFREVIPRIAAARPTGILLVATNPVDALTHYARKLSGFGLNRVVGSGTILDTARLRVLLGDHYGVDPQSVHAYIIGEHGDSQVPAWSTARIAGLTIQEFCRARGVAYDKAALDEMALKTRNAYYRIVGEKGATVYGIASGLVRVVGSILRDQNTVLTVGSQMPEALGLGDVTMSLPTVVNAGGIGAVVPLQLDPAEGEALTKSAAAIRDQIAAIEGA
jgi:L-lactate dehydrogenase